MNLWERNKRLIIPFLFGVITALFWSPSPLSFLLAVAFAPIIIFLERLDSGTARIKAMLAFYVALNLITLRWIWTVDFGFKGYLLAIAGFMILPLLQTLPLLLVNWSERWVPNVFRWLLWPVGVVILEIVNSQMFLGFPWLNPSLSLGSSFIQPHGLLWMGILGGTLVLCLINVLAAIAYLERGRIRWSLAMAATLIAFSLFIPVSNKDSSGVITAAIARPEVDPYNWKPDELYRHSRNVIEAIDIAKRNNASLLVFPEGYLRDFGERQLYTNNLMLNPAIRDIATKCQQEGVSVMVGGVGKRMYEDSNPPTVTARQEKPGLYSDLMNIVILIDDKGEIQYRAKCRLVPFMERAPFLSISENFDVLRLGINNSSGSYLPDEALSTFDWKGYKLLPLICYESFVINELERGLENVDFAVAVSNEAWSKDVLMTRQHVGYDKAIAAYLDINLARSSTIRSGSYLKSSGTPSIRVSFGELVIRSLDL